MTKPDPSYQEIEERAAEIRAEWKDPPDLRIGEKDSIDKQGHRVKVKSLGRGSMRILLTIDEERGDAIGCQLTAKEARQIGKELIRLGNPKAMNDAA